MIRITISDGMGSKPKISVVHHSTGEPVASVFPLYRTRRTGRWHGKPHGMPYFTPNDREHLLNEAKMFAEGFRDGYEHARRVLQRFDDKPPTVTYQPDAPYAVRQREESIRGGEQP